MSLCELNRRTSHAIRTFAVAFCCGGAAILPLVPRAVHLCACQCVASGVCAAWQCACAQLHIPLPRQCKQEKCSAVFRTGVRLFLRDICTAHVNHNPHCTCQTALCKSGTADFHVSCVQCNKLFTCAMRAASRICGLWVIAGSMPPAAAPAVPCSCQGWPMLEMQ